MKWFDYLESKGLAPKHCRRVIIDIRWDDVVKVYYECFGDEEMFKGIDVESMLANSEVISLEQAKEKGTPKS